MFQIKKVLRQLSGLAGMCLLLCVIGAQAASLTVSNTADAGFGSLRQAIIDATTNTEANIVTFSVSMSDPGYNAGENSFTINLLSPLPSIPLAAMTINNFQGQGMNVKGNSTFRIFTLVNSAVLTINNLTISNGFSSTLGGGIFMGNSSTLTLNGSTVSGNTAASDGGGVYMANSGTLTLLNSNVRGNTAINGGGVFVFDSGTLNVTSSTISNNNAISGGNGGGVYNGTSGTINAGNSTFDGNSAVNNGGGVFSSPTAATATFTNNTITGNFAGRGGGFFNSSAATFNNNLVALNTASDGPDLAGRATLGQAYSGSFNLVGNADGSEGLGPTTNQLGTTAVPIDPRIGPLRDNGGPTFTRALHTRSPAIDKGNSPSIVTDQRGRARPYDNLLITNAGNGADIGSYERTFTPTPFDYDADGKADVSVYRAAATGTWYIQKSTEGSFGFEFGTVNDKIAPADYDADGKTDLAVYRPSTGYWYVFNSETSTVSTSLWGASTDVPTPGDYDGDGRADVAIFRPSDGSWWLKRTTSGTFTSQFGQDGDVPALGDYDGDGSADLALFRPLSGTWYIRRSTAGDLGYQWGISGDKVAPADYDADGKTDIAVYRIFGGRWFIANSGSATFQQQSFGAASDLAVSADYDGDGRSDIAIFRPSDGNWWLNRTTAGLTVIPFGQNGDEPTPNAFSN